MCGKGGDQCGCGSRDAAADEPRLMQEMMVRLGVGDLLSGADRAEAGQKCRGCTDRDICRDWLDLSAIRGADHAPSFCRNAALFDRLASELPDLA